MSPTHSDVLIVGAGIIGMAHAITALDQGLSVTVVERDERAVGASVRNFGHVCTSAQERSAQPMAQHSRAGWLRAAEAAAIDVKTSGCVTVARSAVQLRVLEELAAERGDQVRLLTPAEVHTQLGGLGSDDIVGGAHLRDDLRVDPRTTVGKLAAHVEAQPRASVHWRHNVLEISQADDPTWHVRTNRGAFIADRVIVCVGHDLDYLYPDVADEHDVRRCRLSMGRARMPQTQRIAPAVLTGTSMARYGAFVEQPSAPELLAELRRDHGQLVEVDANVMATQLPDGSLIVGDTHDAGLAAPPFLDEQKYQAVSVDLAGALGLKPFEMIERWQGVYATSSTQDILHSTPRPGLDLVTVTSGIGMTMSFGIAARTFGETF